MTGRPVLLVAAGDRVDAGKTTFSTGLLARLDRGDARPIGVKPRAGNDYWFDHDAVRSVLADGRLHGKDAGRLAAASAGGFDERAADTPSGPAGSGSGGGAVPEAINPLHRLWRPTPDRTGMLGEPGRTFLVDRAGGPAEPTFVVNGRAADAGLVPDAVREALPLADAPRVREVPAFNDLMAERYVPAFDALADRVRAAERPVVIESYGDVALPLDVAVDAVAVVRPGRARIYAGDRYLTGHEAAAGIGNGLEERTGDVTERIEPLETVPLPALPDATRTAPERVAEAYADAHAALLDAV